MFKSSLFFILFVFILLTCGQEKVELIYISFSNEVFDLTNPDDIEVYQNRKEIKQKYFEIGVFKSNIATSAQSYLEEFAEKGAHAVIVNKNNFTLIRFYKKIKKDESDAKII